MHILIATSGVLPAATAVDFATEILCGDGTVTVTTVIEVPRTFLDSLHADGWNPLAEEDTGNVDENALMNRYVEERGRRLTEPIVSGLRTVGVETMTRYLEGSNPAKAISMLANEIEADVIMLGATRQIFDNAAWESVSVQVMAESDRPVLVLPGHVRDPGPPSAGAE